jgi:hypothetical protein
MLATLRCPVLSRTFLLVLLLVKKGRRARVLAPPPVLLLEGSILQNEWVGVASALHPFRTRIRTLNELEGQGESDEDEERQSFFTGGARR